MDAFSRGKATDESLITIKDRKVSICFRLLIVCIYAEDSLSLKIRFLRRWFLNFSKNLVMLFKEGMLFTNCGTQDACAMCC
jgi:hypothetical protein